MTLKRIRALVIKDDAGYEKSAEAVKRKYVLIRPDGGGWKVWLRIDNQALMVRQVCHISEARWWADQLAKALKQMLDENQEAGRCSETWELVRDLRKALSAALRVMAANGLVQEYLAEASNVGLSDGIGARAKEWLDKNKEAGR